VKASPVRPDSGAHLRKIPVGRPIQVLQNAEVFISSRTCKWGESGESLRSRSPDVGNAALPDNFRVADYVRSECAGCECILTRNSEGG